MSQSAKSSLNSLVIPTKTRLANTHLKIFKDKILHQKRRTALELPKKTQQIPNTANSQNNLTCFNHPPPQKKKKESPQYPKHSLRHLPSSRQTTRRPPRLSFSRSKGPMKRWPLVSPSKPSRRLRWFGFLWWVFFLGLREVFFLFFFQMFSDVCFLVKVVGT